MSLDNWMDLISWALMSGGCSLGIWKAIGRLFGGGGGGGGNITYNVPQPAAPTPIDYNAMYDAATRSAIATMREEEAQLQRLYPTMTGLQFGTVNELARGLDNEYLGRARGVIGEELMAASQPNQIEATLQRQAQEELALGRSLSPEQMREASQSARQAFAARGLGTSAGSSAAEILNRDAYGQQRLDARRQFALGANQLDLARRQRRLGLAGGFADLDPYARATGPAFQVGSANTGQGLQAIGQTFGNALQASGNVASFNTNMQAGMFNSWQNNNAAMQAAAMQAGASRQAGTMGMLGSIGGGLLSGAGMAMAFSDKRMKKDIKPLGKAGSVLGLTAYEFSYKGEKKKRKGFMAQDVKKVLPEAVAEVDYKGKKRLAIKPAVIGAALAEELMAAKAA
jgi:hypothetical protein